MPRPTKLTPATQKQIVDALRVGSTHRLACQYAGITEATFYYWLQLAARGYKRYSEFSDAVKKAEGDAVVAWLLQIETAAKAGAWQAAAWKLERRYPQEFGKPVQEHTGKDEGPILVKVVYEAAPVEDLAL